MQFSKSTTIAVSDGRTLRMFRNTGDEKHLQLEELAHPTLNPHDKGSGKRHHSSAANPDDQRLEEDSYASATAEYLNQQVLAGEIEQLYVVAPPRTLGELRRHYHASLRLKLLGELGKEHTHDTIEVLHKALIAA